MSYNWQKPDWPDFKYSLGEIEDTLHQFSESTGFVTGALTYIHPDIQQEIIINIMVAEAVKTSAIEGEFLSREDVVSSIRNKLGLIHPQKMPKDLKAVGAGELMVEVRNTFSEPLSNETLFKWHTLLLKSNHHINLGTWRKGIEPMQVISGPMGGETIHFEAPPSSQVPLEMEKFITWFNDTAPGGKKEIKRAPVRSAIAHLYFESIHPFEDGNGRVGRAIAEKALSQTIGRPVVLSLSHIIEANKTAYYKQIKTAQTSNEISGWIAYFVDVTLHAQQQAKEQVAHTLKKTRFMDTYKSELNERQLKAILKMLDAGPDGFEGGMTAKKYMSITRSSKATATRDLQTLMELGAFINQGGGRSTHYSLNM